MVRRTHGSAHALSHVRKKPLPARVAATLAGLTRRERDRVLSNPDMIRVMRLAGHDPAPARDREGLAVNNDDGPTPEMRQHAEVATRHLKASGGGKGHQRVTRLERLRIAERISPSEYDAGERLHDDWAFGVQGIHERSLERVESSGTPGGMTDAQLAALGRYQAARAALVEMSGGRKAGELVQWVACEDVPWSTVARKLGVEAETAQGWACTALAALAEHYAVVDGARRTARRREQL